MNKGFWGIAVAAAFVFGMFVSAGPVYGPHFSTWDGDNWNAYLGAVDNKLSSVNKFFVPPGDVPSPGPADRESILEHLLSIREQIGGLQTAQSEWRVWCGPTCD